jgi:hypothetical protein
VSRRSLVLAAVVLTLILLWMNRYRFDRIRTGEGDSIVRVNRFTGSTEILYLDGWRKPAQSALQPLQASKLNISAIESGFDSDAKWNELGSQSTTDQKVTCEGWR